MERHAVSYVRPFRAATWRNATVGAPALGIADDMMNNYAVTKTPAGFVAIGGGVKWAKHSGNEAFVKVMHKPSWGARWSAPRPVFGVKHPGCVDARIHGYCEYDGKLSLAAVNASHFRVYARANMATHGGRHVVTALCSHHACEPFSLVQVVDYALKGSNNIYFMCVEFVDDSFVGYAPMVEQGGAYIGLSTSRDGVSWTAWARVATSERDIDSGKHNYRNRAIDQPVCGMLRRDGRTTLYVQREVAGIYAPGQDCCRKPLTRFEAVDVTATLAAMPTLG